MPLCILNSQQSPCRTLIQIIIGIYNNLKNYTFAVTIDLTVVWYYMNLNSQNQFLFYYAIAYTASVNNVVVIVSIAGITPTNYSVSYNIRQYTTILLSKIKNLDDAEVDRALMLAPLYLNIR